jgi:hypothetical protein
MEFLGPDDKINMRQILEQGFAARLSHAAKETKHNMWPLFRHATEHSHFAKCLLISHVTNATCIQEHDVGLHLVRDPLVPARHERMRDLFRVAFVHLAPVGLDEKFRHGWAEIIHGQAILATERLSAFHLPGLSQ